MCCLWTAKQIGIGSELGFSILDYSASIQNPQIVNLTNNDGISSNIINKILFNKDTFYLATNKGISIVPAKVKSVNYNIPVYLIDLYINDKRYPINSTYKLAKNQNSIRLQLGGVELQGHFKQFEYSVDEGNQWTAIKGNMLNLELESGTHKLLIRALDINNNKCTKPLILFFDIAIPYWKAWWFLLLSGILIVVTSLYAYQRYTKRKHKQKINEFLIKQQIDDFEIQALKAQINPHFVFNCLNSIKALIYEEKLEDADLYLNTFGSLLRTTLNYSSTEKISLKAEVDYIDNYLQLEKLRFNNKFNYEITVGEDLNQN
jgi:hypothetical protein